MARPILPPLLCALLLSTGAALGDPLEAVLEFSDRARVAAVIDGDTLVLADGREVRLVGIQAPKLPLGRPGFVAWPLAEEARDALATLAEGADVELGFAGRRVDRHGRLLAHLRRGDGLWLQGAMVEAGWARVYGFHDNRALLPQLYALESAARADGRGIWSNPYYAVLTTADLERRLWDLVDSFQLVEGRVQDAAVVRGRGYLNFGDDWKQDVTASIAPEFVDLFGAAGLSIEGFAGRRVRLRGWVESYNGPMIAVTHPEQIEVLE